MFLSRRNGTYYLWYKDQNGRLRKVSTRSKRKSDALKFFQSYQEAPLTPRSTLRLSDFFRELQDHLHTNYQPSTIELYQRSWHHLISIVGDVRLSSVTAFHFDRYKAERLKQVSATRVNIELRTLKAALGIALRWRMISENPFARLNLPVAPKKFPVTFTTEQLQKLLSSIKDDHFRNLITVGALSGLRRGELLNLKWVDLDFERCLMKIESSPDFRTKNGKSRLVPMNPLVKDILLRMKEGLSGGGAGYIFSEGGLPLKGYVVSVRLRRLLDRLKLPEDLHFHSLRHSFASWLALDGVSIYQISKLLGHSDVRVTQEFYAHLQPEHLHEAVNRIRL